MDDANTPPKSQSKPPHPLRRYRDRQNLTMRELGELAGGLVESEISRIESGARDMPSCAVMLALASATEHEVGELDIFRWHFFAATGQQAVGGTIGYQPQRGPSVAAAPPPPNPIKETCSA